MLPVDRVLPEVVAAVAASRRLVLTSPPGSGKTTRVPPALADAFPAGTIVVLEPRRVAARAAARRVAHERGQAVGGEVGFQVRHERCASNATRILFVTEGILVRRLVRDPFLEGVAAVVLDEFHERHVETDLALAMLAEVRETVRDDLAVIAMSATLDAEPVAQFLGGAPIVTAAGAVHPVEVVHVADPAARPLAERVRAGVLQALDETHGDVLAFLPGVGEIRAAATALADPARRRGVEVLPLHGSLSADEQDRALTPDPRRRRVVLATNVAESSLTIEGVSAVVDAGLARVLRHDPGRALDTLRVERISRASAAQRAGRAGRTGPGRCYRLWSPAEDRGLAAFETPEIRRTDLAGPALLVRAFAGRDPREFGWFEAPEPAALSRADELLHGLGALRRGHHELTSIGRAMLAEPVHPRLARLLVEADRLDCRHAAAEVAALLSERELPLRGATFGASLHEHLERLHAVERAGFDPAAASARGVDARAARAVVRLRDRLARRRREVRDGADIEDRLARAVLAGFPDRVARRPDPARPEGVMVGGRGLRFEATGAGDDAELQVALRLSDTGGTRTRVTLGMEIHREHLEAVSPEALVAEEVAEFDAKKRQVVAVRRTRWFDLVLEEHRGGSAPDPAAVERMLAAAVREAPVAPFADADAVENLRARVRWLRVADPDTEVPAIEDAQLADTAAAMCAGRRALRDLKTVKLAAGARRDLDPSAASGARAGRSGTDPAAVRTSRAHRLHER